MGGAKGDNRIWWTGALLVVAVLAVYWQVWDFEFITVDDYEYVTGNPPVLAGLSPQTVRWAITGIGAGNWHPLTWISLMADTDLAKIMAWVFDASFGRDDSGVYHLTNLALHLANVIILFLLLNRMTGYRWRSAFVAILFGIHPMHVESVAWVSERKDVLSTLFWLLTTWAYVGYAEKPEIRRYALVAAFLALGLMAKPMLVTVPIVLLLMDYWPLRRGQGSGAGGQGPENSGQWTVDSGQAESDQHPTPSTQHPAHDSRSPTPVAWLLIREKLPLFAIAAASCVITFVVQRLEGAVAPTDFIGIGPRLANALVSYAAYIGKMLWPFGLAVFYPLAKTGTPWWWAPAAGAGLAAATYLAVRAARRHPYIAVGWLWYLVTLLPVIGIVQVGGQAMADRYTYVPYIGLFIATAWGVPELLGLRRVAGGSGLAARVGLAVLAGAAVVVLMAAGYRQVGYWRNDASIWAHTIAVTGPNTRAHYNLGCSYDAAGELDLAAEQYREALRIEPSRPDAHTNLGFVLLRQHKLDEAKPHFVAALKQIPNYFEAHNNLGLTLARQGKIDEAIVHFRAALKMRPGNEMARKNLDAALAVKRARTSSF